MELIDLYAVLQLGGDSHPEWQAYGVCNASLLAAGLLGGCEWRTFIQCDVIAYLLTAECGVGEQELVACLHKGEEVCIVNILVILRHQLGEWVRERRSGEVTVSHITALPAADNGI